MRVLLQLFNNFYFSISVENDTVLYFFNFFLTDPAFQDTSGSAPHFMLATGGNDNLVKLWDIFTASGILPYLCHGIDTKEKLMVYESNVMHDLFCFLVPVI